MYPTIVVALVQTQCSMMDIYEINSPNASRLVGPGESEARPATPGHLSFAARSVHSTTDSEPGPQRALLSQGGQEHLSEETICGAGESQVVTRC